MNSASKLGICMALLSLGTAAHAQEKKLDPKKAKRQVTRRVEAWLRGRSPAKMTALVRAKGRKKKPVYSPKRMTKAFWDYLPKYYRSRLDKKAFGVALARKGSWEGYSAMVQKGAKVTRLVLHRNSILVEYRYTPMWINKKYRPGKRRSKPFLFSKKPRERTGWDVWTRLGGKFRLARYRFKHGKDTQSRGPIAGDRKSVMGETLIEHPLFKGTVSATAMSVALNDLLEEIRDPNLTDMQRNELKPRFQREWKGKRVADTGIVEKVVASGGNRVELFCENVLFVIGVSSKEMQNHRQNYMALRKGDLVMFRSPFRLTSLTQKNWISDTPGRTCTCTPGAPCTNLTVQKWSPEWAK